MAVSASNKPLSAIKASKVRYIKLGRAASWESDCLARGIIRFGFESGEQASMRLCEADDWDGLAASWIKAGKDSGTATRYTNETRYFFQDQGGILWVTFIGERFCWGFLEPGTPTRSENDESTWRRISGGWRHQDLLGVELNKSNLSGSITKLASYRGTSCWVDVADRVVDRINGKTLPAVEKALACSRELESSLIPLIETLGPRDFEVLIELIFSASGWRRLDRTGGNRKMLDLDLELPTTGERAFVQVKTRTSQAEFEAYLADKSAAGGYSYMFYVFHTGRVVMPKEDAHEGVVLMGPNKLARMAINAGLTDWVLQKVR